MDRNFDTVQVVIIVMVALRKESVDRNIEDVQRSPCRVKSLSARRAWIEIDIAIWDNKKLLVALRKESVDRNLRVMMSAQRTTCRSPQGERG